MTIRTSFLGGSVAGAVGAALGGAVALAQGEAHPLWLYSALGALVASMIGWAVARRRLV